MDSAFYALHKKYKIVIIAVFYSKIYMIRLQQYLYVLNNKVSRSAVYVMLSPLLLYIFIYIAMSSNSN